MILYSLLQPALATAQEWSDSFATSITASIADVKTVITGNLTAILGVLAVVLGLFFVLRLLRGAVAGGGRGR